MCLGSAYENDDIEPLYERDDQHADQVSIFLVEFCCSTLLNMFSHGEVLEFIPLL
jgi:hypothetical protein